MCQLNVKSQAAHSKDVTIQQMAWVAEGVIQLAKSSLMKEKHGKVSHETLLFK